ncbi:phosphoribosyltransferase [Rhizobium phaseoli]|uniref:phosphoribosyltransferase n=1 Tax=Rhizobium phaseoli TaxID=396 RepID=UPI0007EB8B52|nr:phosphoribosyltransferase [Rhizobium phaseoli]ANL39536.1 phosphoribosyltransferase domain-containing protein [Rhizobium phaseoli]ANL58525.1 phosphoribosyltransferase domain-containing protein [Rhizobium phaseoli]
MTDISVTCLIPYNAEKKENRPQVEWEAIHMKRVVKAEPLNGSFHFWVNGVYTKINKNNVGLFQSEINKLFAAQIMAHHPYPVAVVPIPNGDGVIGQNNAFRTLRIATTIVNRMANGSVCLDMLRWNVPVGKAHLNQRARRVDDHLAALQINGTTNLPVVIFDDFLTTGSQMAAAKIKLEEAGYNVVGCYTIFERLDAGAVVNPPGWKNTTRSVMRIADFFANIG